MDWTNLIAILAMVTMIIALGFAYMSKVKVDKRRADDKARKSTLAEDKSSKGKPADV